MQPYNPNETDQWYNTNPAVYSGDMRSNPVTPYGTASSSLYQTAARRVHKKINFYKNLSSYAIVCTFLWILTIVTGGGAWPIWVMLGWGVGLAFQAVDAFNLGISDRQKQQMIDEEMRRINSYGPRL
ncbi:MAG TPA: 2TM domain-containing protein [Chloroflexia bacterium]|nr:2TM domain-containing protein [Chloroflexia bacterium]